MGTAVKRYCAAFILAAVFVVGSGPARADIDYKNFEEFLDKYDETLSNRCDDLTSKQKSTRAGATELLESRVVFDRVVSLRQRLAILRKYIEFKALVPWNKQAEFEGMLYSDLVLTRDSLTYNLEEIGSGPSVSSLLSQLKTPYLVAFMFELRDVVRDIKYELERYVERLKPSE